MDREIQFFGALKGPGLGQSQRKAELGNISSYLLLNDCCVPGIAFVLFHLVLTQFGFPNKLWR